MSTSVNRQGTYLPVAKQGSAQTVNVTTGASASSAAFSSTTEMVRIVANVDVWYIGANGSDPTAGAEADDNSFLPAGVVEVKRIPPGGQYKIAAIADSTSGVINYTEDE